MYCLDKITLRTNESTETMELVNDILSARIPLLFDSDKKLREGISIVFEYTNYKDGFFDLSVLAVRHDFFKKLDNDVDRGIFKKIDVSGDDFESCSQNAWKQVGENVEKAFESIVPSEFTRDGKIHCYLYVSAI